MFIFQWRTGLPPKTSDCLIFKYSIGISDILFLSRMLSVTSVESDLSAFFTLCASSVTQLTPTPTSWLPPCSQKTGVKRSFCNELDTICVPSLDPYLPPHWSLPLSVLTGMTHSRHGAIQASTLCDRNSHMPTKVQQNRSTPSPAPAREIDFS